MGQQPARKAGAGLMLPLVLGAVWVIAAALLAMLPMPRQIRPGLALLVAAPLLLIWIGATQGWLWTAFGAFAFLSMFRRPLIYFYRKANALTIEDIRREKI
jgi:hypothetical protein